MGQDPPRDQSRTGQAARAADVPGEKEPSLGSFATHEPTESALDSISEGFVILDRDWRFVFVNPAAERFVQKSRAELIGQCHWELFPEAGSRRFGLEYRRAVSENVPVHFEEYYPEPLNKWYEVRAYPSTEGLSIFFRDVTERRLVEEALSRSEARYRSLFNSMTEGFAVHEIVCDERGEPCDYRFLEINPAFESLTGLEHDRTVGRLMSEVLPNDDPVWVRTYGAVALTGVATHFDHYSAALERHYDVFAYRPAPRQFATIFHDITQRKQLEEALRVNLTKYSVLFDSFPLGISVTDSRGNLREANRAAGRLLGLSDDEHTRRRIDGAEWRIIRPDGSPMPADEFASVRALQEKRLVEDVEMGMVRPGEETTWISVSAAPIPLDGYGVVITYGDVTPRRHAEARLEEAHREAVADRSRLEATMDALPTGVAILDAEGGIIRSNAAYETIWGVGRPLARSVADYAAFKAWWLDSGREVQPEEWASARAVRQGESVTGQVMEIQKFDGGRAFVLNSAAPIFDASGHVTGCAVAIHDITRRVEAEHALAMSEAALLRVNDDLTAANNALRRSKETLEARVAARTADLARRTAQLEALAQDLTRAEERERQRVAQVIHDHLQQMLSVARINLGMALEQVKTRSIKKGLSDVDGLLAESLDITRSLTAELSPAILHRSGLAAALRWLGRWYEDRFALKVLVETEEGADLDEEIRVTLFRSVRELLFNVVKHAKVTSATVRLDRPDDGGVRIVVSDEGIGFDPDAERAREGTLGSFGLFSLRERLESLGGRFEVDSAPGRGASFTIVAPPPQRPAPGTPESGVAPTAPSAAGARTRTRARQGPSRARKH